MAMTGIFKVFGDVFFSGIIINGGGGGACAFNTVMVPFWLRLLKLLLRVDINRYVVFVAFVVFVEFIVTFIVTFILNNRLLK